MQNNWDFPLSRSHPTVQKKGSLSTSFLGAQWDSFAAAQATSSVTNLVLIPLYKKKEVFRLPSWVPSGIRTHDIQNHNLTL